MFKFPGKAIINNKAKTLKKSNYSFQTLFIDN